MMKLLLGLSRAIDALNEQVGKLTYWLILAAVLISTGNAIVRYTLNTSSNAWLEIQWYLFSFVFLFCAGYTLLHNQHVRIDIVTAHFSRPRPGLDRHPRHAFLPAADGDRDHVAVVAGVPRRLPEQGDLHQRRRPAGLAGAG